MDDKNNKNNVGGGGFTWGLLIGAVLMFLFATKTGRKILRELSAKGIDMLEDLATQNGFNFPYEEEILENEVMEENFRKEVQPSPQDSHTQTHTTTTSHSENTNGHSSSAKKFFRGIKRK